MALLPKRKKRNNETIMLLILGVREPLETSLKPLNEYHSADRDVSFSDDDANGQLVLTFFFSLVVIIIDSNYSSVS